jgi:hypothetical protein
MLGILLGSVSASAQDANGGKPSYLETSFDVLVHAPPAEAMKLFTPEGERAWAGAHWDPQHIHAAGPTRDAVGAVFTIQHGPLRAVWTVTGRDDVSREYKYAYFLADLMVTSILILFEPLNAHTTSVHVRYERTTLSPAAQTRMAAMEEQDKKAGAEWQSAIDRYLAAKTTLAR